MKFINFIKSIVLTILFSPMLFSCGGVENPEEIYKGTLLYLISDNSLNNDGINNVNQLEAGVTGKEKGRVFVFLDGKAFGDYPYPTLFEILPDKTVYGDGEKDKIISKVIKTYPELDACSMSSFEGVVADIKKAYRNVTIENLILSSHATSWVPPGSSMFRSPAQYSFGDDDSHDSEMDIKEMAATFEKYNFKTIVFDACHMAGVEVFYQFRNCADYLIGSAAPIYAEGFPYKALASHFANSDISPLYVINEYYDFYKVGGKSRYPGGTIVYVDCSKLEKLAWETKQLISRYYTSLNNPFIVRSLTCYAQYPSSFVYDFKQYMNRLSLEGVDLRAFDSAWGEAVKSYRYTNQVDIGLFFDNTFGLSFYAPLKTIPNLYNDYYKTLDWASDSGFDLFL